MRRRRQTFREEYRQIRETYGPANSPVYMKNGKKYIKVVSGRESRYLLFPEISNETIVNCTPMSNEYWTKLVEKTKIPTLEQRKQLAEEYLRNRTRKQEEIVKRKSMFLKGTVGEGKTEKLNPLEVEYQMRKAYTIRRADELKLDEEDTVKEFNKMVALKKCIATWDQQVIEKMKIKEEEKDRKLNEERQIEERRKENLLKDEVGRQKEHQERQNFINALNEQIIEREIALKIQMEQKQIERNKFNRAARQAELDEQEFDRQKVKINEKVREEQRRVNVLLQRLKAIDKEEDRLFAKKAASAAAEIHKELEDMEEVKREIEKKRTEELKKMTDEKIRQEEKAKYKDLVEEILRMDNVERTWRQKETMEALKKEREDRELFAEREKQVINRRIAKAQVIEEERREVCKIAKENIEDETKERETERKIKLANEKQRMEILLQINEIDQRKQRDKEFRDMECSFYKIQEERRAERAKNGMWRRADQVRKDGLPNQYANDIECYIAEKYGPRNTTH